MLKQAMSLFLMSLLQNRIYVNLYPIKNLNYILWNIKYLTILAELIYIYVLNNVLNIIIVFNFLTVCDITIINISYLQKKSLETSIIIG